MASRSATSPTPLELEETAREMETSLGLAPEAAAIEAFRALHFLRDYHRRQQLLNGGDPVELAALVDGFGQQALPAELSS